MSLMRILWIDTFLEDSPRLILVIASTMDVIKSLTFLAAGLTQGFGLLRINGQANYPSFTWWLLESIETLIFC